MTLHDTGSTGNCRHCGKPPPYIDDCPGALYQPKVVTLVPKRQHLDAEGMEENLAILDNLKAELQSGKIVSISGVCIAPDDGTYSFNCVVGRVSKLRTMGALSMALHMFLTRAEKD